MNKNDNKLIKIFTVIGFVAVVAAIAYAVYRFLSPDYLEDFEDDFDDDFDDYFEDEAEPEEAFDDSDVKVNIRGKADDIADEIREAEGE